MHRKSTGYFLLYFFSFCISTGIFHIVAVAQASNTLPQTPYTQSPQNPSPTLYEKQTTKVVAQAIITQPPLPTPTVYIAPVQVAIQKPLTPLSEDKSPVTPTPFVPTPTAVPLPLPTAIPAPQPVVAAPVDLDGLFSKYASEYGVDTDVLKRIAKCESGFNPTSNNAGMYLGMFQFAHGTWVANRNRMGVDPNPDLRMNAEEAIRTAAFVISRGGRGAWPNC